MRTMPLSRLRVCGLGATEVFEYEVMTLGWLAVNGGPGSGWLKGGSHNLDDLALKEQHSDAVSFGVALCRNDKEFLG